LQPLADGLKLLLKQLLLPTKANSFIFLFAPILLLTLSLISWSIIPFGFTQANITDLEELAHIQPKFIVYEAIADTATANIHYGLLFLLAISSLNVYGIIIAG
jgi:NADH-quinone oxidoreductase subunit H